MDLFVTKKEQLLRFCRDREFVSKADIMKWGLDNFYISADRVVRTLVEEGKMKHLTKDECLFRGLKGKMAWYQWKGGA